MATQTNSQQYKFIMDGLNCANCAAKIEEALSKRDEFTQVSFSFATKRMTVVSSPAYEAAGGTQDGLRTVIQEVTDSIEDGVQVQSVRKKVRKEINILEGCGCCSDHDEHNHEQSVSQECCSDHDHEAGHDHSNGHANGHSHNDLHSHEGHDHSAAHNHVAMDAGHSHEGHSHGGGDHSLRNSIIEIAVGLALLIGLGMTDIVPSPYDMYAVIAVFLVIGRYVFMAAYKNALKGRWMDENFLMGIATVGAVCIGDFREALGVMLFYRIGTLFEERATEKSRQEIMSVIDMRPENVVIVQPDGSKMTIPAEEAEVGQVVQVRAGDRIPLDGTVLSGQSRIDTSPVTGEPKPVAASEGTELISGCINLSGVLHLRVDQPLEESFVSKILAVVETATSNKPTVDRFITRFAKYYTPIVLLITILTIVVPSLITGEWKYWIYTGLTFLVISCPCALVLSVPLAFFAGIGGSSKQGILFKGGMSMENMKNVKVLAMDKTGTLTEGKFAVQDVETAPSFEQEEVLALCASIETLSSHPIATSIREKAETMHLNVFEPQDGQEFAGEGIVAVADGHEVLCGNRRMFSRYGIKVPASEMLTPGASEVFVAIDGIYAGRLVIRDILKQDAIEAVQKLRRAGYVVAMVTGDAPESAAAVAKEAGIDHVYAGLMPIDKLRVLQELRQKYGAIMFIGDGINDAPVLAGANVGCAMGSGADAALEAADVVFMNSEVMAVNKALQSAKKTMSVAWQNVIMAILFKVVVMIFGFVGYASLWLAIFADTGVMIICVLNAIRLLYNTSKGATPQDPGLKPETQGQLVEA